MSRMPCIAPNLTQSTFHADRYGDNFAQISNLDSTDKCAPILSSGKKNGVPHLLAFLIGNISLHTKQIQYRRGTSARLVDFFFEVLSTQNKTSKWMLHSMCVGGPCFQ